jgi:putative oxidoreductase
MGLSKALHPVEFLKLVRQYEALPQPLLLNLTAAGLPWFEVICGLLLVAGIAVRGTALLSALMLVPFTIMVTLRGLDLAHVRGLAFCDVKFDCGCGAGEVFVCYKIVENVLLLGISLWLLFGAGRKGAWRYSL